MVTPNIDKLSNEGYQFNNAYAQVAICGPSRASVLTGTRPDSNLIYDLTSLSLRKGPFGNNQTLPQFMKDNGYYTVDCGKTFDLVFLMLKHQSTGTQMTTIFRGIL